MASPLLDMQAPRGLPLSSQVQVVSDPIIPGRSTREVLQHFFDDIYDLRPESHMSRLLGVLLGDAGVGQLRKKFTYTHLSQSVQTSHFYDIDRLFADVFGFSRLLSEGLGLDPYHESGTAADWESALASDASYRNRVIQFIQGVNAGPTVSGITKVASAVVGHPVRIYEMFHFIDDEETYDPIAIETSNTYGDLESKTYAEMNSLSYASLEGSTEYQGRSNESRTEFLVRPLRPITPEENYQLIKIISRLKPVGSMLTIDPVGITSSQTMKVRDATSPSNYWHVRRQVVIEQSNAPAYARYESGVAVEQPRPVFSEYQGEEWHYNADVLSVASYAREDGVVIQTSNFDRIVSTNTGRTVDYAPERALVTGQAISRGRAARDGVLSSPLLRRTE